MLLSNHLTTVIQVVLMIAFVEIIFKPPNGTGKKNTSLETKCFLLLQTKLKLFSPYEQQMYHLREKQKPTAADVELLGILVPLPCL